MGRRKDRARTPGLWIATNELPPTGGHPFYQRLNQVLDAHAFDDVRRSAVRAVLRGRRRAAESDAGHVLPAAVDRLLRRHRLGARHRVADRRFARAARLPGPGPRRGAARALDDLADAAPDRSGDAPRGVHVDPAGAGDGGSRQGQDDRDRCDDAGGERGLAEHRAARLGRDVSGVSDATGAGLGHRDADARRSGAARSEAPEERPQYRVAASARSRRAHHEDEGRPHASRAQGRARGRHGDRRDRGRDGAGRRSGRHDDDRRDGDDGGRRTRGRGRRRPTARPR